MPRPITAQEFLEKAIDLSGKTQREIALEVGYDKPNVLSMMKKGTTKIPVEKVPALARATGVDPAQMLRIVMTEYNPDVWAVIVSVMNNEPLSDEEKQIIADHRAKTESVEDSTDA